MSVCSSCIGSPFTIISIKCGKLSQDNRALAGFQRWSSQWADKRSTVIQENAILYTRRFRFLSFVLASLLIPHCAIVRGDVSLYLWATGIGPNPSRFKKRPVKKPARLVTSVVFAVTRFSRHGIPHCDLASPATCGSCQRGVAGATPLHRSFGDREDFAKNHTVRCCVLKGKIR